MTTVHRRSKRPVPPDRPRPASAHDGARHEVRIIGGQWKRSRLPVLDRPGLRPTSDRLRETLFNWLGQDLRGWRVLDAFAGSGALGFEAASRGAGPVLLLERDLAAARNLSEIRHRLQADQVEVRPVDALAWMARAASAPGRWDLVLLDPPFDADLFAAALSLAADLLADGGLVYLEADRPLDDEAVHAGGWVRMRQQRFGAVHAHLLGRETDPQVTGAQSFNDQP